MKNFDTKSIAAALGGDVRGREVFAPGPGKNKADRSLLVRATNCGTIFGLSLYSFVDAPYDICREHVYDALGDVHIFPISPAEISLRWWHEAEDICGTLAERYLRSLASIPDDSCIFNDIRTQLRFHPSCPFGKERLPCLLVLERDIFRTKPSAVIRIALDSNGNSIGRLYAGRGRKAVKFCNIKNTEELAICESVEMALAGITAGYRPVWSLGEKGLIYFPNIYGVRSLKILVKEDSPELRKAVVSLKSYGNPTIELFKVTTDKNTDGTFSVTSSPIPRWRKKQKQLDKVDIEFDDVNDFFE